MMHHTDSWHDHAQSIPVSRKTASSYTTAAYNFWISEQLKSYVHKRCFSLCPLPFVGPASSQGRENELFGISESLPIQLLDAQSGVPWLHNQAPCSGWTSWIDSACFGLLLISTDVDKSDTRRKWQLFWRVRPLRDFSAVRSLAAAAAASHEPSGVFVSSQDRTRWTSLHFCFFVFLIRQSWKVSHFRSCLRSWRVACSWLFFFVTLLGFQSSL